MPRSGACFPRVETSGGTSAVRPPLHPGGPQSRRVGPVREVSFPNKHAQPRRRPTKQLRSATPSLRLFPATNTSPQPGPRASPRFGSTHTQRRHLSRAPVQDSASRPSSRSRARAQTPGNRGIILSPNFFQVPKTRKQSQNSGFSATRPLPCFPNPKFQHISSRWRIQEAPFCPYHIGSCERPAVRAYASFGC